jgi:hypothetical protein
MEPDGRSREGSAPDGESIYVLDGGTGSVYRLTADRGTGELHYKTRVALVSEPKASP